MRKKKNNNNRVWSKITGSGAWRLRHKDFQQNFDFNLCRNLTRNIKFHLTFRIVECYYCGSLLTKNNSFDIAAAIFHTLEMNDEIFRLCCRMEACNKHTSWNTRCVDVTNALFFSYHSDCASHFSFNLVVAPTTSFLGQEKVKAEVTFCFREFSVKSGRVRVES